MFIKVFSVIMVFMVSIARVGAVTIIESEVGNKIQLLENDNGTNVFAIEKINGFLEVTLVR